MFVCPSVCSVTRPAVGTVVSINTLCHRPSSLTRPMRHCSVAWKLGRFLKLGLTQQVQGSLVISLPGTALFALTLALAGLSLGKSVKAAGLACVVSAAAVTRPPSLSTRH